MEHPLHHPSERFDINIKTKNVNIRIKKISRTLALAIANEVLEKNPNDEFISENLPDCIAHFGKMSTSQGVNDISISGYLPVIKTGEKQTCGRRMNDIGPWVREKNLDEWEMRGDDKCCSFCGSMHPDRVIELMKLHGVGVIEASTKQYKLYIKQKNVPNSAYGGIKYYRYHDTPEFIKAYNELVYSPQNN